ncbi:hypothetical protein BMS_1581 [Halobacteriovorax marinus SJ]|uniref:Uncharacterized protein n=1 Tax=Halobacteriovorax marinus (strain ATCC BAA-682 / DSM 15412 / SJ) TaxID=862908 RepID=E1X0U3_HALMS|nr:hypothetical protein [Halobacteriovorax marinus]CBW26431.1 hypothetical protein BMS_1581 [Halobacteriovorax marinus SJ]
MKREFKFNNISSCHYINPGKSMNDLELTKIHKDLVSVNNSAAKKVDNLFLNEELTLEQKREHLSKCILTLLYQNQRVFGFLISPIISSKKGVILHAGLIMMNKNPGADFMAFTGLNNFSMAYEEYGNVYVTNISSTPSIIEVFSNQISKVWPSPKMNTKVSPPHYRDILHILKMEYMDKYFPSDADIEIDDRRFTMTSNSKEMGFSTNFYKLSRATNYLYQSFCQVWINYDDSEDIIQVGRITLRTYLYQKILLRILSYKLNKASKKLSVESEERRERELKTKKAA